MFQKTVPDMCNAPKDRDFHRTSGSVAIACVCQLLQLLNVEPRGRSEHSELMVQIEKGEVNWVRIRESGALVYFKPSRAQGHPGHLHVIAETATPSRKTKRICPQALPVDVFKRANGLALLFLIC